MSGNEAFRRGRREQLLRENGEHRCWISGEDREKLVRGGHVVVVGEDRVRLLSDVEKRAGRRTLEAVGLRTERKQSGIGKVF